MDFEQARAELVEILRQEGISAERVLKAIASVPRHLFVPRAFRVFAYDNRALPIGREQTISQPYTVAYMLERLNIDSPALKVLEIGTGSGYQTALLAYMGCEVFSIERDRRLFLRARRTLRTVLDVEKLRRVHLYWRDGLEGLPRHAPYPRIIASAAVRAVPFAWLQELALGGVLVFPLMMGSVERMAVVRRPGVSVYTFRLEGYFRFVEAKPGVE